MKKALIFYISKYSGHFHGARAIERGLYEIYGDVQVELVNALEYTNPILGKMINKTYLEIIKKKPELWGNIYDNPSVLKKTEKAREAIHRYNMSKIKRIIERNAPDVIICTQAFPCGMVADYKKTSGDTIPLIGVLTDYAPHSYWLHDEVDYYVTPSEKIAEVLGQKGVRKDKLKVYGIPVDPRFRLRHDRKEIRAKLGLVDGPTILIMGGSQGIGAMEEVVKGIMSEKQHNYQLLVITGTNKKLYAKISRMARSGRGDIKVFPYVENTDELMEASDVIITKAGGLTTAEALVKELPVLIVNPIPGHERMNTDYLVGEGAAIELEDFSKAPGEINRLFDSRKILDDMREKAGTVACPESCLNIAKLAFGGA
jgi:processive 1,2-diacylglycerol beta-glucosyltransferase